MRIRNRLEKAAMKSKSPAFMSSYRKARNATNTLNTQIKKKYDNEKVTACKGDIKASWRVINEIIDKKSKSTNIDYIRNYRQEICSNNEIANLMNDYFCTTGAGLAKNIEETVNPLLSGKSQIKSSIPKFRFRSIMVQDIKKAIAKFTTLKS